MIKLVRLKYVGPVELLLGFSNGTTARWSADDLNAHDTVLTRPLAWSNGLELSAEALHRRFADTGALVRAAA